MSAFLHNVKGGAPKLEVRRWRVGVTDLANTTVSIVIPTKNAGAEFRETLAMIRAQTRKSEIVVVDSGSSDGTVEIAREYEARTISIQPDSFNHGETRNLGIRESSGQFCIMLVQDAIPVGPSWLEELIAPFSDELVVGVTGRQRARTESDPVGRWQVDYHNRFLGDGIRVQELENGDDLAKLNYQERLRLFYFDNVCSAMRREFWENNTFQRLPFAEDLDWGVRAIRAGRRLVHNPSVCVIHSHTRPADYHLRRSYISGKVVPKLLQLTPGSAGVKDDGDFVDRLGRLCGEAQSMMAGNVTDLRAFSNSYFVDCSRWEALLGAMGLRVPQPNRTTTPPRANFYFILDQLAECAGTPSWNSVIAKALAEAAGSFTASYYNWCESRNVLSPGMRSLDQALSKGV